MFEHRYVWTPLPLRLILGCGFMYHGYPKLFTDLGHKNIVHLLAGVGVPWPELMAWVVGILEFFGGLFLVVGLYVTLVVVLNVLSLTANILQRLFLGDRFPEPLPGQQPFPSYEDAFLYIAGLLALFLGGAGMFSLNWIRAARRKKS